MSWVERCECAPPSQKARLLHCRTDFRNLPVRFTRLLDRSGRTALGRLTLRFFHPSAESFRFTARCPENAPRARRRRHRRRDRLRRCRCRPARDIRTRHHRTDAAQRAHQPRRERRTTPHPNVSSHAFLSRRRLRRWVLRRSVHQHGSLLSSGKHGLRIRLLSQWPGHLLR